MDGAGSSYRSRFGRRLANLLLVAMVVYLSVWLARVTWMIVWQGPGASPVFTGADAVQVGGTGSMSQPLAAYPLFGQPDAAAPVADVVRESAPETRLRLRLEGVLVAERAENSGAIVAGTDGVTEYYRVGDALPGNAELVEVEPGRILLKRNGMYETLTFDDNPEVGLVAEQAATSPPSPDGFVEDIQARLDTQGAGALVAFGLTPVQDGSASGYAYNGSNAMLNAANLKAGDVITAINGQSLGNFEQDRALLESWRELPQLDIEIDRNGARFTVSYAIPEQWR